MTTTSMTSGQARLLIVVGGLALTAAAWPAASAQKRPATTKGAAPSAAKPSCTGAVRLKLIDGRIVCVRSAALATSNFAPDAASTAVNNILNAVGLKPNFQVIPVDDGSVANASAAMNDSGTARYILYNPHFLDKLNSQAQTDWAGTSVLAHEIGHHLNFHTLPRQNGELDSATSHRYELDADEFSGLALARLGATLDEATAAMRSVASEEATMSHPGRDQRVAAIGTGWCRARTGGTKTRRDFAPAAGAPGGAACGGDPGAAVAQQSAVPAGPPPSSIVVAPTVLRLLPGERVLVLTRGRFADGEKTLSNVGMTRLVEWQVFGDGNHATVDSLTGEVTGLSEGTATLAVKVLPNGPSTTATIRVDAPDLALAPDTLVLPQGKADTVKVLAVKQDGRVVMQNLRWRSRDPAVAVVVDSMTGVIQGASSGTTTVQMEGYGTSKEVTVHVFRDAAKIDAAPAAGSGLRVPQSGGIPVTVRLADRDGAPIDDPRNVFRVADSAIARYDAARHLVVGLRPGTTTLTYRGYGFDALSWPVQVVPARISLSASRIALPLRKSLALHVAWHDSSASGEFGTPVGMRWTSSDTTVVTVNDSGRVVPVGFGRATVTTRAPHGVAASADVFVVGDVLFTSNETGAPGLYQALLDAPDGRGRIRIADSTVVPERGVWSPDRTRIAVVARIEEKRTALFVMDADGQHTHIVAPAEKGSDDWDDVPRWTADGRRIVFSSTRLGDSQLFSVTPDGDTLTQLTDDGRNRSPSLGPNGLIVYETYRSRRHDIMFRDTVEHRLTDDKVVEERPLLLPDGGMLILADSTGKGRHYMVLRVSPGDMRRTAVDVGNLREQGDIVDMALSRDGATLALVLEQQRVDANGQQTKERVRSLWVVPLAGGAPPRRLLGDGQHDFDRVVF